MSFIRRVESNIAQILMAFKCQRKMNSLFAVVPSASTNSIVPINAYYSSRCGLPPRSLQQHRWRRYSCAARAARSARVNARRRRAWKFWQYFWHGGVE
ncbi:hypothetical protein TNIN_380611 [Trichonephila inaurata madagascariensis]|uniref:Uncharacterized protein n=1 Tax=Trichonephila inaurata madagascariensis TaxID=2747483 RepID=A0A8X6KJL0_9ARAC|nr:hypothetical protein TNIN_380611 [Trichonephila inaurata madagascariensis]